MIEIDDKLLCKLKKNNCLIDYVIYDYHFNTVFNFFYLFFCIRLTISAITFEHAGAKTPEPK